jgi:hypothetical protein
VIRELRLRTDPLFRQARVDLVMKGEGPPAPRLGRLEGKVNMKTQPCGKRGGRLVSPLALGGDRVCSGLPTAKSMFWITSGSLGGQSRIALI